MTPEIQMLLMFVLVGAFGYFFMIRPQKKRLKEQQEMFNSLQPGSRVVLTSGVFATIAHVAETQMIVELAPGVEVTILKQAIIRLAKPDEEEFEFTDETGEAEDPAGVQEVVEGDEALEDADSGVTEENSVSEKN
ncbi:preprotein translocase subunit YajC [Arachnia rubra]|uniref:Preprotein translocase subunit YajC n=1 Tax=Arachnia rubra TaxID=1547448 RepID=A0ABX7Y997_9ACTN|nr:preprotein translocase subunit YajC [Arachnia rubra]QUC09484.1 preprotein translocase subunit YajC [Arachnia rubra]